MAKQIISQNDYFQENLNGENYAVVFNQRSFCCTRVDNTGETCVSVYQGTIGKVSMMREIFVPTMLSQFDLVFSCRVIDFELLGQPNVKPIQLSIEDATEKTHQNIEGEYVGEDGNEDFLSHKDSSNENVKQALSKAITKAAIEFSESVNERRGKK